MPQYSSSSILWMSLPLMKLNSNWTGRRTKRKLTTLLPHPPQKTGSRLSPWDLTFSRRHRPSWCQPELAQEPSRHKPDKKFNQTFEVMIKSAKNCWFQDINRKCISVKENSHRVGAFELHLLPKWGQKHSPRHIMRLQLVLLILPTKKNMANLRPDAYSINSYKMPTNFHEAWCQCSNEIWLLLQQKAKCNLR